MSNDKVAATFHGAEPLSDERLRENLRDDIANWIVSAVSPAESDMPFEENVELLNAGADLMQRVEDALEAAERERDEARAALARVTDYSMAEVIAFHTPTLVGEGPNGEDEGQHLYCVVCGVLPIDGLGFQDGPGHVLEQIRAVAAGEQEASRG